MRILIAILFLSFSFSSFGQFTRLKPIQTPDKRTQKFKPNLKINKVNLEIGNKIIPLGPGFKVPYPYLPNPPKRYFIPKPDFKCRVDPAAYTMQIVVISDDGPNPAASVLIYATVMNVGSQTFYPGSSGFVGVLRPASGGRPFQQVALPTLSPGQTFQLSHSIEFEIPASGEITIDVPEIIFEIKPLNPGRTPDCNGSNNVYRG